MKKFLLSFMAVTMAAMNVLAQSSVPPTSATQEEWRVAAIFTSGDQSEDVNEAMTVAFDGNDIYFNFPNPITGNTWMKGTRNGETVTFAKGQKVGAYGGQNIYYMGLDSNGLCDIVFNYDEANGLFTMTDMWLTLNGSLTENSALGYFSPIVVTKKSSGGDTPTPEVVTPPAGLKAAPYIFSGTKMLTDEEGGYLGTEEVKYNVKVGFYNNNTEVFIQGLCNYLPEAWVKGTVGEEFLGDQPVTFAKGQFYGQYGLYPLYLAARQGNYLTNMVFNYDPQTRTFTNEGGVYLVTNLMPDQPAVVDMFVTATLSPGSLSGIQSVTADHSADDAWYTLQGVRIDKPGKGIFIYKGKKIKR